MVRPRYIAREGIGVGRCQSLRDNVASESNVSPQVRIHPGSGETEAQEGINTNANQQNAHRLRRRRGRWSRAFCRRGERIAIHRVNGTRMRIGGDRIDPGQGHQYRAVRSKVNLTEDSRNSSLQLCSLLEIWLGLPPTKVTRDEDLWRKPNDLSPS